MIGIPKANVFPVPVRARPIMSFPCIAGSRTALWTSKIAWPRHEQSAELAPSNNQRAREVSRRYLDGEEPRNAPRGELLHDPPRDPQPRDLQPLLVTHAYAITRSGSGP
ncbi:hypothetical protein U9M48_011665 [Paspalum notatum var. saurae]|uniref:Uncharacterized protein n=1 Tax=Paspalum notatum var. saurae TaxID=547442 RepID=A0AAQ3WHS4_PASNO